MRWVAMIFLLPCAVGFGGTEARQGDIEVSIWKIETAKVALEGGAISEEPVLQVHLRIHNRGRSPVTYRGWSLRKGQPRSEWAGRVQAIFGGASQPVVFGDLQPQGQVHDRRIPPGGRLEDLLVFDPPARSGQLSLTLPGRAIGSPADFLLTFLATAAPAKPQPVEPAPKPASKPIPVRQEQDSAAAGGGRGGIERKSSGSPDPEAEIRESGDAGDGAAAAAVVGGFGLMMLALILVGFLAFFLPLAIAVVRSHHQTGAIAVINIFLGWSFVGWIVALAMACSATDQPLRGRRYDDEDY